VEKCIEITVTGDPCPNDATVGEYCIIHAPGWDKFKANVVMLFTVYGYVTTALGIISTLGPIVGLPTIFNVMRKGETRTLKLADLKDSAESLIRILDLLAGAEDPRGEIENIGGTVILLHEDVLSLVEHLATSYHPVEASGQKKEEAEQR